jgi:hydrogenase-1 operon protein HyaF
VSDDVLVDTLLTEVARLLARLIEHGETGRIDLRALPLSPACLARLEQRLGSGDVTAVVAAAGRSEIHETNFPGVWWSRHADDAGRLIGLLIEVTDIPAILRAERRDMARGLRRLPGRTDVAAHHPARRAAPSGA